MCHPIFFRKPIRHTLFHAWLYGVFSVAAACSDVLPE